MSPLPFLRLPILVQREILRKCNELEIIIFSFCSRKTWQVARSVNMKLYLVDVAYGENRMTFDVDGFPIVVLDADARKCLDINDSESESETVESIGFGGIPIHIEIDDSFPTIFVPWQESFIGTCNRVIDYVMDLFSQEKPFAEVGTNVGNVMNIPFDKWLLGRVMVCQDENEGPLNQQELTLVMEELEIIYQGQLELSARGVNGYSTGLWHNKITIYHGDWLHLDAVMNSDSTYITIYDMGAPRGDQLKTLVMDWIYMQRMQKLENLELQFNAPIPVHEVMNGVPAAHQYGTTFYIPRRDGTEGWLSIQGNNLFLELRT